MFGVAAIVAFAVALILQLASISQGQGQVLTVWTFTLIGLLCLAVHVVTGWWPVHRGA
jgi:hypothetical protein